MTEGSGTRSSLLYEVGRLLQECTELPQILIMENVTQVHSKSIKKGQTTSNYDNFKKWIEFLQSLGYCSKWADLNAKDYGVPQNRDRTIMVSWQGDYYYDFPRPVSLTLCMDDLLQSEDDIEPRYYLSKQAVDGLVRQAESKKHKPTLMNRGGCHEHLMQATINSICGENISRKSYDEIAKVCGANDLSGCCKTIRCGGRGSKTAKHSWDLIVK